MSKHFLDFVEHALRAKGPLPGGALHAMFRNQGNVIESHDQFERDLEGDGRFEKDGDEWRLKP